MDLASITAGVVAVRSGLDTVKGAVDLLKQAKDLLPSGKEKDKAARALEDAVDKLAEGEAAVAKALGYSLCRCEFPPTPMLLVGHIRVMHLNAVDRGVAMQIQINAGGSITGSVPVHQCPKCQTTDAPSYKHEPIGLRSS